MVTKKPPTRLLIPADRRPSREHLLATQPFFLRDLAQVPQDSAPRILSFESDAFMDDFLATAGETRPLPPLRPWRDWSEPPEGLVDILGVRRYPATILRRTPSAAELEPAGGPAMDADGIPHGQAPGDAARTPAWLRKLYLPLHERFNLLAFDVVCGAAGWPRLARGRVKGAGAVIRRLVAATNMERWEDWIAIDEKQGGWLEILDADLQVRLPGGIQADPARLPPLAPADELKLRALFGLDHLAPLPAVALPSQPLNLVPPDAGQAAGHCTLFGYLPVFSSAREIAAERLGAASIAATAEAMRARTHDRLDALFQSSATLRSVATPHLRSLLEYTVLPARPTAIEFDDASVLFANLVFGAPFGVTHPDDTVAQATDLALREALGRLWHTATSAVTDNNDIAGNVVSGSELWLSANAAAAASEANLFSTLPDANPLPGNQTAAWLAASAGGESGSWDALVRVRLFQLIDAWLAGSPLPLPPQGQSTLIGEDDLAALCVIALLRLRGCRLALAASINRTLFGDAKAAELTAHGADGHLELGLAALGEMVDGVLAQESGRGDIQATPPWPALTFSEIAAAALPRVMSAHQAGNELARIHARFDAELATAGNAAIAQLDLASSAAATRIGNAIAALNPAPAFAATGLDLADPPARGLLVLPAFRFSQSSLDAFRDAAAARYAARPELAALPEARATDGLPRLRFDAEHLYAAWGWVRIAGRTRCEPERILWTRRSEPFTIADPTDLLGARPASIQMPDIPRLIRDIPRIARARARPFAGMAAPPGSAVKVGAAMADTRRDYGIGMICNFGIPVLTICALILFNIIFHILIALPGFAWMLFLKFCIPFPKRGP